MDNEEANLIGMAHGVDAYNDAMGWSTDAPGPCGHHCTDDCPRCGPEPTRYGWCGWCGTEMEMEISLYEKLKYERGEPVLCCEHPECQEMEAAE
ncbi:MAG: hypothetical protein CMH39_00525 [Micrococcales bacterium]|nr:hypothetical protein [Micrococcales bacterium]